MFFIPIFMISTSNIDDIKEAIYWHCKGRQTLKIGSLMTLRGIIDGVIHDTSRGHFRTIEACHYLKDQGYITIRSGTTSKNNVFSIGDHFATPKLWEEFKDKEKEEQSKLTL